MTMTITPLAPPTDNVALTKPSGADVPEVRTTPPTPEPQRTAPEVVGPELEDIIGEKLMGETLQHAHDRGSSSASWLAREQLKFWSLEEKAAKLFRSLKHEHRFADLVNQAKAAHRARVAFLAECEAAGRHGDRQRAKDAQEKVAAIDTELSDNLAQREDWEQWRLYRRLGHLIDVRLKGMRAMWAEKEKVPFEDAWKGEYGDR